MIIWEGIEMDGRTADDIDNPIRRGEAWSDAAIADIEKIPAAKRSAWMKLLQHCVKATRATPSATWLSAAEPLIANVAKQKLLAFMGHWLPLLDRPRTDADVDYHHPMYIRESNQDILRGLIWCCSLAANEETAKAIAAAATSAFQKIPQVGARSVRIGNACVYALGQMPDAGGVTQLAILKVKVKNAPALKLIKTQLAAASERLHVPCDMIEETSVPAYGLQEVGVLRENFGEFQADITVGGSKAELRWIKPDGKTQKSVPATIKRDFADELKQLKVAMKEIDKMLPVQRERIDGLFAQRRQWPIAAWQERYADHPLVGTIARRCVWRFLTAKATGAGTYLDGQLVGIDDKPLKVAKSATVELWHPIDAPTEDVLAWRTWVERHEIRQPFKQAHREVYLLTDAERDANTYSNRFAAHILRQAQYRALARTRGWTAEFLGPWDGGDLGIATRMLDAWHIRAELWVTPIGDGYDDGVGFTHISTDQVRFHKTDDAEPMPLEDVPPHVFSEVMRDVDLFVGVASVGNDPDWTDSGPEGYRPYWESYSFGDLSATASTRKAVLERQVPRLKIADRCSITDRFLIVRGDLRTYKIHLGSSNILMEPNDQYLCIVPDSRARSFDKVYLPFEGDSRLSVILSKAFLLADDEKITDPRITSQIR